MTTKIKHSTPNACEIGISDRAPTQRVNVDFRAPILAELDIVADELNVSRQAVIKLFVQRELDGYSLAKNARVKLNHFKSPQ